MEEINSLPSLISLRETEIPSTRTLTVPSGNFKF